MNRTQFFNHIQNQFPKNYMCMIKRTGDVEYIYMFYVYSFYIFQQATFHSSRHTYTTYICYMYKKMHGAMMVFMFVPLIVCGMLRATAILSMVFACKSACDDVLICRILKIFKSNHVSEQNHKIF